MTEKTKNPSRIRAIIVKLIGMIRSSLLIGTALDAEAVGKTRGRSFIYRAVSSAKAKNLFLRMKLAVSSASESSAILWLLERAEALFLGSSLRSLSLFCFTFGSFLIASEVLTYGSLLLAGHFTGTFLFAMALLIISFILFPFSKRTVASALSESRVLPLLLYERFPDAVKNEKAGSTAELSLLFGLICGTLSVAVSAKRVLIILLLVAATFLIFKKPENGVLLLALLLPVLSERFILMLMVLTVLSTLFKLLRGKRAPSGKRLDTLLWIICLATLLAGIFSFGRHSAEVSAWYLIVILYALSFLTLLNSSGFITRIIRTTVLSGVLTSLYILLRALYGVFLKADVSLQSIHGAVTSAMSPVRTYTAAVIMLCVIPLLFSDVLRISLVTRCLSFVSLCACLILMGRIDALMLLLIAAAVITLFASKVWRRIILSIAALGTAVCLLLPQIPQTVGRLISMLSFADVPKVSVMPHILPDALFTAGSGVGTNTMSRALFAAGTTLGDGVNSYTHLFYDFGLIGGVILLACLLPFLRRMIIGIASYADPDSMIRCKVCLTCAVCASMLFAFRVDLFADAAAVMPVFTLLILGASCSEVAQKEYIAPYLPREEVSHGE